MACGLLAGGPRGAADRAAGGALFLPDDWPPEQAVAEAELLIALHDAIWDRYGWALEWEGSGPPPSSSPVPAQLALSLTGTEDLCP